MNIEKLMKFIGYGASHPEFDEFLHDNGVKKRPKGDESTVWITDATKTITMEFSASSTYNEEHEKPAESEGWFVLRGIGIDQKCIETLPFGLDWKNSKATVDEILKSPVKTAGNLIAVYYHQGLVVTVRFDSGGSKITSISLSSKDMYHKKNLGI